MSKEGLVDNEEREVFVEPRKSSLHFTRLVNIEQKFFDLVSEGKVEDVDGFLKGNPQLNINCVNYQGLTALHLAVKKEHEDLVKLLIGQEEIELKDVVLHAVATGNMEITKLILDALKEIAPDKERSSYEYSPEYDNDITPLILAAQCGDFQMVRMLIERGHKIERPHKPSCLCKTCKALMSESGSNFSRMRLNAYKAISNPAFICQDTNDPIYYSFVLDSELGMAAVIDKEFQTEYLDLGQELRQFIVDLISFCRNPAEMEMILKQKFGYKGFQDVTFPRLQVAVDFNQKEFVGHSLVQQVLNSFWLGEYWKWNRLSIPIRGLRVFARIFELPLIALAMLFAPTSKYAKKNQAPVNKYISSVASYLTFLLMAYLLSYIDGQRRIGGSPKTGLEVPVIIYVLGFMWSTGKQLWVEGRHSFFRAMWHWYDMVMELLFVVTFILWHVSRQKLQAERAQHKRIPERKYWDSFDPTLMHEGIYAIACIMAFGRLAYFCLLSSRLGPLQISMGKMQLQIAYFLIFCFLLITAFAVPMTRLYVYYSGMSQTNKEGQTRSQLSSFTSFRNSFGTFFWAMFCMSPIESVDVVIENIGGDKANPKLNSHVFTEAVGRTLFALYEILMVIAMVNTLIAILSNTFQRVVDNADIEWKFARTKLWLFFFHEADTLPSPYNLLPTGNLFASCYKYLLACSNKIPGAKAKFSLKRLFYIDYKEDEFEDEIPHELLMTNLAQRYFRSKEEK